MAWMNSFCVMRLLRLDIGIYFHAQDKRQGAKALQHFCRTLSCLWLQLIHVGVLRHAGKIANPCLDAFLHVLQKHIAAVLYSLTEFDDHPDRLAIRQVRTPLPGSSIRWIGIGWRRLAAACERNEQATRPSEGVPLEQHQGFEFVYLDWLLQIIRLSG